MSSVGPNEAACFGPRTKLSKACNSPPDQNRLPETVLGPFQDRTKLAVTEQPSGHLPSDLHRPMGSRVDGIFIAASDLWALAFDIAVL